MSSARLADFQDAFATALLAPEPAAAAPSLAALVAQPGFAVYRNGVLSACIDALQSNYPTIARLVGDEWFRAAAAVHARAHLPVQASLLLYGAAFPEFLATFPPAGDLPWLAAVARVDRAWSESHVAADEPALDPAHLRALAPADMAHRTLRPHAAARWVWSDDWPVHTLWRRNRTANAGDGGDIVWNGEGVLLTRPGEAVEAVPLTHGGAVFLDACAAGTSIAAAVGATLAAAPGTDLAAAVEGLLRAGAFTALAPAQPPRSS